MMKTPIKTRRKTGAYSLYFLKNPKFNNSEIIYFHEKIKKESEEAWEVCDVQIRLAVFPASPSARKNNAEEQ